MVNVAEGKRARLSLRSVQQTPTTVPESVTRYDCNGGPDMQLAAAKPFLGPKSDLPKSMEERDSVEFLPRLTPQGVNHMFRADMKIMDYVLI